MNKRAGVGFVLAGAALILSALSLFLYNQREDACAGQQAEKMLRDVREVRKETPEQAEPLREEMPVKEIGGYGYVGELSLPSLELELPVMSEWSEERLKIAPCRQFGSSRTDDLVIAAHNYKNHFGKLKELRVGDRVIFTDLEGVENIYAAARIETLSPNDVDRVQNSGCALVLYTCTYGGKSRVTVFCDRVEE